ncbi:MAG: divalent-cation tolerance protein CutA [Rhodospirillaceae bacterium]|nr:divalent-cation tolerance protein CutA [Rhodospirillaceae bacterium]
MSNSALLVLTTCANADEADEIAGTLVEKRLAACVNRVDGVMSTYAWESRLQRDKEILLLIKTTEARFDELQLAIVRLSSYDVPEIIAVPVRKGSKAYLDWLAESVS